jgi:DNA (cytosine-5)-methyltransferase 1
MGYHRAGFEVVGVDIRPQPRYPFEFHQGDALDWLADVLLVQRTGLHEQTGINFRFHAIHASPPCQAYSRLRHLPWLKDREYPRLLEPTWRLLEMTGVPWVIENVEDAPMPWSVVLCGLMFDLPLYRHRRFGASFLMLEPSHPRHEHVIYSGRLLNSRYSRASGGVTGVLPVAVGEAGRAMGIDWMQRDELTQAIPPAYTRWIGERLMEVVG